MSVRTLIEFAILGFSTGAIYVALALGLLAIHRATAVLNFAQGSLAMWGAYVYTELRNTGELVLPIGRFHLARTISWPLALAIGLLSGLVLSLLAYLLVFRPLRRAPLLAQVVASIALMITMLSLVQVRFNVTTLQPTTLLPAGSFTVAGTRINETAFILFCVAVGLCLLLWAFFAYTNTGVAMRAASSNERALSLMGYSVNLLGVIAWSVGVVISAAVIILASPATGLDPTNYTLYVIPAMAILLLARLDSLWVIAVAGLALGGFQSIITFLSSQSWWPVWGQIGVQDAVPFFMIVVALFLLGRRLPARGSLEVASLPRVRLPKLRVPNIAIPVVVVVALLLFTHGVYRFGVITSLTTALIAVSYVLLTGYLGQISLAQIGFAGASGFILSKLTTHLHVPFPISLLIAALGAGILGGVVAIPAFRIRGTQLAIVTLAAAVVIQEFVFQNPSIAPAAGSPVRSPSIFGISLAVQNGSDVATLRFGFTTFVVVLVFIAIFIVLARGSTGRAWLAVRSNERAAAAAGLNVRAIKLVGFTFSAVIAGAAGALIGFGRGQVSADSFTVTVGLLMLAAIYVGGMTSVSGALVAGALGPLGIVYVFFNAHIDFGTYYDLVAGLGLLVSTVVNPVGIAGKTYEQWLWARSRLTRRPPPAQPAAATPAGELLRSSK